MYYISRIEKMPSIPLNFKHVVIIFCFFLVLYNKSLNYYFFQDDWFVLNWVRESKLLDLLKFRGDIIYWRPVSMPIFFKTNLELFNINPQLFHLIVFILFFLLLYFIYQLFLKLTTNRKTSFFVTFLYATSSIHFVSISWLSSTSYIIGALFTVLTFYFFLNKGFRSYLLSFTFFILGLLSSELVLTVPAILLIYKLTLNKIIKLQTLSPYFILVLLYLTLRLSQSTLPASGSYEIYFDKKTLSNIIWYVLWSSNFPESFIDLISHKFIANSLHVIKQYWWIVLSSSTVGVIFTKWMFDKLMENKRLMLFSVCWFFLALAPVIVVPDHVYPNYLSIAILGLLFAITKKVDKLDIKVLIVIGLIWFFSSFATLAYTQKTHWIVNEQAVSRAYTEFVKTNYPKPEPGTIFFLGFPSEDFARKNKFYFSDVHTLIQSLNNEQALQVFYGDKSVKTEYERPKSKDGLSHVSIIRINPI